MHPKLTKLPPPDVVEKKWGRERILFNNDELCGKILQFNKGSSFSMHAHGLNPLINNGGKYELFYVTKGSLLVRGINTEYASTYDIKLGVGDVLDVPRGAFHQVFALEESEIIEFSTPHCSEDNFRIIPSSPFSPFIFPKKVE